MARIALSIPRVRCMDETGGSWAEKFGNDEIYLGAVLALINANKSVAITTSGSKLVGNNFDDGETVRWMRDLVVQDLGDPSVYPYPKAVIASLVLAEHDAGNGRNNFLERLANRAGLRRCTDGGCGEYFVRPLHFLKFPVTPHCFALARVAPLRS